MPWSISDAVLAASERCACDVPAMTSHDLAAWAVLPLIAQAEPSSVRLRIEQQYEVDSSRFSMTEMKSLVRNDYGKPVGPSGEKFVGYGVQSFATGGKLLAELFEPASMKQEAGAT